MYKHTAVCTKVVFRKLGTCLVEIFHSRGVPVNLGGGSLTSSFHHLRLLEQAVILNSHMCIVQNNHMRNLEFLLGQNMEGATSILWQLAS